MASDGKLIFDTKIDDSGFKQGLSKLGKTATSVGKVAAGAIVAVSTAVVALGTAATKVGSEFEASMSQVAATMGMTQEEIQNGSKEFGILEAAARQMGATTQYSASEAAEALNYIALAGYDAESAVKLLPSTLNLAAAGGLELGRATDIVTDAVSALGLNMGTTEDTIKNTNILIDEMAKTAQKSNTNVGQLGEAILTVGGTAKDLAGGTVELNTALGVLANNGYKGAEGGTKLRNVIQSIYTPTQTAAKAFENLGIEAYDAEGNMRPINEVLGDMSGQLQWLTTEERKNWLNDVFNGRDLAAVSALLASNAANIDDVALALEAAGGPGREFKENIMALAQEFDQFSDKADFVNHMINAFGLTSEQASVLYDGLKSSIEGTEWNNLAEEISNAEGAAEEMSKVMNDNLQGDIKILKSALEELGISFYQTFDTNLRSTVQAATGVIEELSLAFRGIDVDSLKSSLEEAGVSVDDLNISLVEASFAVEQFSDKADFVDYAMEKWGISSEQASVLFDTLSNSLENSGNTAQIVGEVLGQTISDLITRVAEALPQFLELGINITKNLLDGLSQNIPQITDTAIQIGTTLLEGLGDIAVQFLDIGLTIIENLITGLGQNAPQVIETMIEIVIKLGDTIIEHIPQLIEAGGQLLLGLAQGLADNLPTIIEQAPRLINEFTNALMGQIPTLIKVGVQIIVALAKGLIESIPTLIANIPQIILAIVNAFTLYNWASVGKNLIGKIGEGISSVPELIGNAIKTLLENGTNIVTDFAETLYLKGTYLIEKLSQGISGGAAGIAKAAGKIIKNIVKGIVTGAIELVKAGFEIIKSIVTGIIENLPNLLESGINIIKSLAQFILEGIPNLIETGPQIIAAIISGIASAAGGLISKGAEIIGSFIEGITGKKEEAASTGSEVAEAAIEGFRSSSESSANEVGMITSENYTEGILSGLDGAKSAAEEMGNSVSENLDKTSEANAKGKEIGSEYSRGISESKSQVETDSKSLSDTATKSLTSKKIDFGKAGTDSGKEYASKTSEKKTDAEKAGKDLSDAAAKGAKESAKELQTAGEEAGKNFVEGVKSKIKDITSIGQEVIKNLTSGISNTSNEVDNAIKKIIEKAINDIKSKNNELNNRGQDLIKNFAQGIERNKNQVDNVIRQILQSSLNSIRSYESQFTQVGGNLARGIASGIRSNSGLVSQAAANAVRNAVNAAKRAGQIRSPSRLMKNEVGYYLSAGMAEGIKDGEPLIEDANKNLIYKAEAQLKKLIENGASKDVLKNYLGKNIEDAIDYGNLLLNQSKLDFDKYNSNFKLVDKIKDEINMSKGLIEDAFGTMQFKVNTFLNLPNNQKSVKESNPIEINIYGANFGNRAEAIDYGKTLFSQIERERRRYGG